METAIPLGKSTLWQQLQEVNREDSPDLVEQRQLANLTNDAGWQIVKRNILSRIERLAHLQDVDISQLTAQEVGLRFVACMLARQQLELVVNDVEGAYRGLQEASNE